MSFLLLLASVSFGFNVVWANTEVEVPVYDNLNDYLSIPTATLIDDEGNFCEDPDFYMVYDGVDTRYLNVINTKYVKTYYHVFKAVFPNYNVESKGSIVFKIVDNIAPKFINVPNFSLTVGSKLPNLLENLTYSDNYDKVEDLDVKVVNQASLSSANLGVFPIHYELRDLSNNISHATGFLSVIDDICPVIEKKTEVVIDINEKIILSNYYKITDNYDKSLLIKLDDSLVDYSRPGIYLIKITATDQSLNQTSITDYITVEKKSLPVLKLNSNTLTLTVNDIDYYNSLLDQVIEVYDSVDKLSLDDIVITSNLDITKIGKYFVLYSVTNSFDQTAESKLTVEVIDNIKPTIVQIKELDIPVNNPNIIFQDYFLITDNYDDYEDLIITYPKTVKLDIVAEYMIKITAEDKSKNISSLETRLRVLDLEPPEIITEVSTIILDVFEEINPNFYTLKDNYSKKLTSKIDIDPSYLTTIGKYDLTIIAKDEFDNQATKVITVLVEDNTPPYIYLLQNVITLELNQEPLDFKTLIEDFGDNYDQLKIEDIIIIDNINYRKVGPYSVIYSIKDSSDNIGYATLDVIIDDFVKPFLNVSNKTYKKGSIIDLKEGITYGDNSGNFELIVFDENFNSSKAGIYEIGYLVTDERGNYNYQTANIVITESLFQSKYLKVLIIGLGFIILTTGIHLFLKYRNRKKQTPFNWQWYYYYI